MSAKLACVLVAVCFLQVSVVPVRAVPDLATLTKVASSLLADNDHTLLTLVAKSSGLYGLANIKQCVGKYAPELSDVARDLLAEIGQCPGYVLSDLGQRGTELRNASRALGASVREVARNISSSCHVSQPIQFIKCLGSELVAGLPTIGNKSKPAAKALGRFLVDSILLPMHTSQCVGGVVRIYAGAAGEVIAKISQCVRGEEEPEGLE